MSALKIIVSQICIQSTDEEINMTATSSTATAYINAITVMVLIWSDRFISNIFNKHMSFVRWVNSATTDRRGLYTSPMCQFKSISSPPTPTLTVSLLLLNPVCVLFPWISTWHLAQIERIQKIMKKNWYMIEMFVLRVSNQT